MSEVKKMYKISAKTNSIQVWEAWVEGGEGSEAYLISSSYQLNGKKKISKIPCTPKNVGKANETSALEQARTELSAKYDSQYKTKHYRYSIEDAQQVIDDNKQPQKIENYKDHMDKLPDIVYTSVKFNGSRACVINGELYSKAGIKEEVKVEHLKKFISELPEELNTFDAEVYAHGLSLSRIRSAWLKPVKTDKEIIEVAKKQTPSPVPDLETAISVLGYNPNEDAPKLKFYIFDIPVTNKPFYERISLLEKLATYIINYPCTLGEHCIDKATVIVPIKMSKSGIKEYRDKVCADGYEGLVHYDPNGMYVFGIRTYDIQKDKPRYSAEALVTGCIKAKNGQGTLELKTTEDMGGKTFKGVMKGDAKLRDYEVQKQFIGSWVTYEYEELSDTLVPTKPTVSETRLCDIKGVPLE